MNSKGHTYHLVIRAVFIALIALQNMIPMLGYIPLGFTSLTIIHITVIVAGIMLGPIDGMFVGFVWGILTVFRAFTSPTSPIDTIVFTNPIVSVIPRVLVGLVAAISFRLVYKYVHKVGVASIVGAILGTLTNTILVVALMGTLYTSTMAKTYNVPSTKILELMGSIIVSNGIPELIGAIIITPLIIKALVSATHILPWRAGQQ